MRLFLFMVGFLSFFYSFVIDFFFFKQKTAYEMRISDWSSDVCSSDLSNMYGSPQGEHLAQRLVDTTIADTVFFTNSGAEAVECAIKTEIGRASCRERVCQYV